MEMNKCIQKTEIPEWITKAKTNLIKKDTVKGAALTNYRPIMCLPMMWKILMAQIREKIYYSLISREIFLDKQKGCRKRTRGTEDLYIQINTSSTKVKTKRKKNLAMACKKAYDMVPQSWIQHCLKMYKIPDQVVQFIEKTMGTWKVELTAKGKFHRSKDPKRHILWRCTITITICDSHDATQPHF